MNLAPALDRSLALRLILLLGIVSLFGDIIYEGSRSITGPYLLLLGASAFTVAIVAGFGEFLGYAARLVSGYVADRTGDYWTFTVLGYLMIGAIPLLVFARAWEAAAILILIERLGKGIRSPPKDTILSHAAHQVGRGWGFGLHEALDQVGAVIGPLVFAVSLAVSGGYQTGFAVLAIPFVLLVVTLFYARWRTPDPAAFEEGQGIQPAPDQSRYSRILVPYGTFTTLSMAGFVVFPLMAYHFSAASVVPDAHIPIFYAIAMAVDAIVALVMGRIYDRTGLSVLVVIPLVNIPVTALAFAGSYYGALAGAVLWGISMGGQETVLRAALADLTSIKKRGTAYGIFNTLYGGAWFAGSIVLGILYELNIHALIAYTVTMQVAALGAFFWLRKAVSHQE
jgi:MFS family permease